MVSQGDILELMESSQDTPEIAEAAYLAAQHLDTEQIDRNLRLRYGSGRGFAMFKERFTEMTDYESISGKSNTRGAQIELETAERSVRLDQVTATDVEIGLDKVIRDCFNARFAEQLGEQARKELPSLSQDAKSAAFIAVRGYDLGVWDDRDRPGYDSLWKLYTILTGETLTDPMKTDIIEELVEHGCFYVDQTDVILTPFLTQLEDPYEHLPSVTLDPPT